MSLRVRTRRPLARFRRAGVEFGSNWTELDEAALSDEQRAAILVEPRLEVELDESETTPDQAGGLGRAPRRAKRKAAE